MKFFLSILWRVPAGMGRWTTGVGPQFSTWRPNYIRETRTCVVTRYCAAEQVSICLDFLGPKATIRFGQKNERNREV